MSDRLSSNHWVLIPAFNEEKYLSLVLTKLRVYTDQIIVIDDGSNDATAAVARQFTDHVLVHDLNLGKGAALKTGCEYAFDHLKAQAVILMDGDDQHDPAELLLFDQKLKAGENLILGTRSLWGMPVLRSMGNRAISALVVLFFGKYIPDILSGYRAFTHPVYKQIQWKNSGYAVELEMACRMAQKRIQYSTVSVTTIYHDFDRGMTVLDTISMLSQIIVLRWQL